MIRPVLAAWRHPAPLALLLLLASGACGPGASTDDVPPRFAVVQRGLPWELEQSADVQRSSDSLEIRFEVTDFQATVPVVYTGILPDLFDEGQGAVASGVLNEAGVLEASEVLAKHDENYMPPEVADALEKSGHDLKGNKI